MALLADELDYCADFAQGTCCKSLPCTRRSARYVLTKSHDYDLGLRKDLSDSVYLVQDREPHGRILSTAELVKRNRGELWPIESREYAAWWLAEQAVYAVGFRRKWVAAPPQRAVIVEHETLGRDPVDVLGQLAQRLGLGFPRARLQEASDRGLKRRAGHDTDFEPRNLLDAGLLPADLLAGHVQVVRDRTPDFREASIHLARPAPDFEALFRKAAEVTHLGAAEAEDWARRDAAMENRWYLMQLASRLDRLKAFEAAADLLEILARRDFQVERVRMRQSYLAERQGDHQKAVRFAEQAVAAAPFPAPETVTRLRQLSAREADPTAETAESADEEPAGASAGSPGEIADSASA
jgi:hypothetical protein